MITFPFCTPFRREVRLRELLIITYLNATKLALSFFSPSPPAYVSHHRSTLSPRRRRTQPTSAPSRHFSTAVSSPPQHFDSINGSCIPYATFPPPCFSPTFPPNHRKGCEVRQAVAVDYGSSEARIACNESATPTPTPVS